MAKLPDILYKYCSFKNDNHIKILTDGEIYFADIDQFNDPFEGCIPVKYTDMDRQHLIDALRDRVQGTSAEKQIAELVRGLNNVPEDQMPWKEPQFVRDLEDAQRPILKDGLGLFCLSEIPDSILMWSHYGYNHQGFCIGFKTADLLKALSQTREEVGADVICKRVRYRDKYPKLIPQSLVDWRAVEEVALTKALCWKYEEEHRLILRKGAKKTSVLSYPCIAALILGVRASDRDKQKIASIAKRLGGDISLKQAAVSRGKFALEFSPFK